VKARHHEDNKPVGANWHEAPFHLAALCLFLCAVGAWRSVFQVDSQSGGQVLVTVIAASCIAWFLRGRAHRVQNIGGGLNVVFAVLVSGIPLTLLRHADIYSGVDSAQAALSMQLMLIILGSAALSHFDQSAFFGIVPSLALIGLVAGENFNTDLMVYFLGLSASAVFMVVYDGLIHSRLARYTRRPRLAAEEKRGFVAQAIRNSATVTTILMAASLALSVVAINPSGNVLDALSFNTSVTPGAAGRLDIGPIDFSNTMDLSGSPPTLSDQVVMRARIESSGHSVPPVYFRARVFDEYTGSSWMTRGRRTPVEHDPLRNYALRPLDTSETGEAKARVRVVQYVRLESAGRKTAIPTAAEPQSLGMRGGSNRRGGWPRLFGVTEDGARSILADTFIESLAYRAESLVSVASAEQLRQAPPPPARMKPYTLVPDTHEARNRRAFARGIIGDTTNQYDQVEALAEYLRSSYTYTLTPPRTPPGRDAAWFFLTESRQGYCEMFASTLAALCRDVGIPARVAVGLAPGSSDVNSEMLIYRQKDLHAWTEVYFSGYGWILFDATSSIQAQPTLGAGVLQYMLGVFTALRGRINGTTLILYVLACFTALAVLWPLYEWIRHRQAGKTGRAKTPAERMGVVYLHVCRRVEPWAGKRNPQDTPHEYADIVRPTLTKSAGEVFDEITDLYVLRAYGSRPAGRRDLERLKMLENRLAAALRTCPKPGRLPHRRPTA
jgi:transglutaminase-like putative cysteine protease